MRSLLPPTRMMTASAVVLSLAGVGRSGADSLSASLYNESFFTYEMIVVNVTLHLEEAFLPNLADAREAARQLGRLRRRLFIELRDLGGETLSEALLVWIAFPPAEHPTHDFHATGAGFLGRADPKGRDFQHWADPGDYRLVVCDRERRLESDPIPITLRPLDKMQLNDRARMCKGCKLLHFRRL